jgi:hypothetical protein
MCLLRRGGDGEFEGPLDKQLTDWERMRLAKICGATGVDSGPRIFGEVIGELLELFFQLFSLTKVLGIILAVFWSCSSVKV